MTSDDYPWIGAVDAREEALRRLHVWLRWEGMLSLTGGMAFWVVPWSLLRLVLTAAAVALTPYLVWRLAQAGWYRWLAAFGVLVVLPVGAGGALALSGSLVGYGLSTGTLLVFYVFTWALQLTVGHHLEEASAQRVFERQERDYRERVAAEARLFE